MKKTNVKLTPAQVNEYVQTLWNDTYIGNGDPSLRQTVRETHKLLIEHIEKCDARDEAYRIEKENKEKEKLDAVLAVQLEKDKERKFWARAVGVSIITQVLVLITSYLH